MGEDGSGANAVERLERALGDVAGAPVILERPSNPEYGDYATSVALRAAPAQDKVPRRLAEELASHAAALDEVERASVAGPGFVNLVMAPRWYGSVVAEILGAGDRYGAGTPPRPQRIQVEFVSANPTGPLTVASARNAAYGDSVARLLAYVGDDVEREYYYNDAGAQMELFRTSVEARRRGDEPPEGGYFGEYVTELAQTEGDPVPPMLERIEATLERFRIHFDSWALQSKLEQRITDLQPRLPTYEQEGAIWVRSSEYGDEKDQVIIRSPEKGGLPTYRAADIAY